MSLWILAVTPLTREAEFQQNYLINSLPVSIPGQLRTGNGCPPPHASASAVVTTLVLAVVEEVGSDTDRLQIPEDQDRGCNSDANAASAWLVTSLGEISLWRNGVTDDEWWVCLMHSSRAYFSL